jgi:hypothetical protein
MADAVVDERILLRRQKVIAVLAVGLFVAFARKVLGQGGNSIRYF